MVDNDQIHPCEYFVKNLFLSVYYYGRCFLLTYIYATFSDETC